MEKKKISFSDLVNVMSQKEMKNVRGGSGSIGTCSFYSCSGPCEDVDECGWLVFGTCVFEVTEHSNYCVCRGPSSCK